MFVFEKLASIRELEDPDIFLQLFSIEVLIAKALNSQTQPDKCTGQDAFSNDFGFIDCQAFFYSRLL